MPRPGVSDRALPLTGCRSRLYDFLILPPYSVLGAAWAASGFGMNDETVVGKSGSVNH